MLVVITLRLTGPRLSLGIHLATDLVALNVYSIVVPRYWSNLTRNSQFQARLQSN